MIDCCSGQDWIELKLLTRLKLSLSRMLELKQEKEITYQYCTVPLTPRRRPPQAAITDGIGSENNLNVAFCVMAKSFVG